MNHHEYDKLAGLLYGSFIADALALGAHWIYDQEELRRDFGRVTDFLDPREDSYHPSKKRGEQTHYGDQALTLMNRSSRAADSTFPVSRKTGRGCGMAIPTTSIKRRRRR